MPNSVAVVVAMTLSMVLGAACARPRCPGDPASVGGSRPRRPVAEDPQVPLAEFDTRTEDAEIDALLTALAREGIEGDVSSILCVATVTVLAREAWNCCPRGNGPRGLSRKLPMILMSCVPTCASMLVSP